MMELSIIKRNMDTLLDRQELEETNRKRHRITADPASETLEPVRSF